MPANEEGQQNQHSCFPENIWGLHSLHGNSPSPVQPWNYANFPSEAIWNHLLPRSAVIRTIFWTLLPKGYCRPSGLRLRTFCVKGACRAAPALVRLWLFMDDSSTASVSQLLAADRTLSPGQLSSLRESLFDWESWSALHVFRTCMLDVTGPDELRVFVMRWALVR